MAILSSGASGISRVSYRNLQKKETAVIVKSIDQLPQNFARVHNLVLSFATNHKSSKFFYCSHYFHCVPFFFNYLSAILFAQVVH